MGRIKNEKSKQDYKGIANYPELIEFFDTWLKHKKHLLLKNYHKTKLDKTIEDSVRKYGYVKLDDSEDTKRKFDGIRERAKKELKSKGYNFTEEQYKKEFYAYGMLESLVEDIAKRENAISDEYLQLRNYESELGRIIEIAEKKVVPEGYTLTRRRPIYCSNRSNDELRKEIFGEKLESIQAHLLARKNRRSNECEILVFEDISKKNNVVWGELIEELIKVESAYFMPVVFILGTIAKGENVKSLLPGFMPKFKVFDLDTGEFLNLDKPKKQRVEGASPSQDDSSNLRSLNIVNADKIVDSNIAQAGQNATKSIYINDQGKNDLLKLINEIKSSIAQMQIDLQNKNDLQANISTIESQLNSSKPKKSIFSECLASIRKVLEGIGSTVASGLINKINDVNF